MTSRWSKVSTGNFASGLSAGVMITLGLLMLFFWLRTPNISGYSGDGRIEIIPTPILAPGYLVHFEAFDMSKPFQGKFTFSGLPNNVTGWPEFALYVLSLDPNAVHGRSREYPARGPGVASGSLYFRLEHKERGEIFDIRAPLTEWISHEGATSDGVHSLELYFLSDELDTGVNPKLISGDSQLTFTVEYEPGESPVRGFGVPRIRAGGYK